MRSHKETASRVRNTCRIYAAFALAIAALATTMGGCPQMTPADDVLLAADQAERGEPGTPGEKGDTGQPGAPGLSCWDLNGNGLGDPEEDVNGDGNFDALDCQGQDGLDGQDGLNGQDGLDGQDGLNGQDGLDGQDGLNGQNGTDGIDGQDGLDGQLRIYGDGSAGALIVSQNTTLTDANLQYTNFEILAGVTLTVPSGAVIRCTGSFTSNGRIEVGLGAYGAIQRGNYTNANHGIDTSYSPPHPGISYRAAGSGELGNDNVNRWPGEGGEGLGEFASSMMLYPGPYGGGGGGLGRGAESVRGGGTFTVLAMRNITINSIAAEGEAGDRGDGGGGGGVVVLASKTRVTLNGTISANGGAGGENSVRDGCGGGGGGGIVHLLAPIITNNGTVVVAGGLGGQPNGQITQEIRAGGGGGGASGGNGGDGRTAPANNNPLFAFDGQDGYAFETLTDPTALF